MEQPKSEEKIYPIEFLATVTTSGKPIFHEVDEDAMWVMNRNFFDLVEELHCMDLVTCGVDGNVEGQILQISAVLSPNNLLIDVPLKFYARPVGEEWHLLHPDELPEWNLFHTQHDITVSDVM